MLCEPHPGIEPGPTPYKRVVTANFTYEALNVVPRPRVELGPVPYQGTVLAGITIGAETFAGHLSPASRHLFTDGAHVDQGHSDPTRLKVGAE